MQSHRIRYPRFTILFFILAAGCDGGVKPHDPVHDAKPTERLVLSDNTKHPDQQAHMVLEVQEMSEDQPREIKRLNAATIENTVKDLSWSDITFVVLKVDDKNWIEGSGSLKPSDGLSARYMKDGKEHVSTKAPKTLDDIISLLQSYYAGDGRWQDLIDWD